MLSFIREDSDRTPVAASSVDMQTLSEKADQNRSGSQDFLVPSASSSKVKYSTIMLSGVFIIGLFALFMMIKKSTPAEAQAALSEQDLKIENAIAKLVGSKSKINSKMEDVVKKIAQISQVEQVDVKQLKRNPFKMQNSFSSGAINIEALESRLLGRPETLLKLWSVMERDGARRCMINDKILKVSDKIDSYTVKKIGEGFVELSSEKGGIVLRIAE